MISHKIGAYPDMHDFLNKFNKLVQKIDSWKTNYIFLKEITNNLFQKIGAYPDIHDFLNKFNKLGQKIELLFPVSNKGRLFTN